MKIADLPFVERPVHEMLHFDDDRIEVDRNYAGYGWCRVPEIWIGETGSDEIALLEDALVLALHSADDGEALPDDIELEFELPGGEPVTVLLSQFLAVWLPALPRAKNIVLAMCNPHDAVIAAPKEAGAPLYYATGDVESWIDDDEGGRLELLADGSWARLPA